MPLEFGGSLLLGKRKSKRPFSTKRPIHLTLKSEKARGIFSFVNHRRSIEELILKVSKQYGIKIYDKAVNWDHIHFVFKLDSLKSYQDWIRVLTSEIVSLLAKKTGEKLTNFFTHRLHTKILTWGKQFQSALDYIILNQMEIFGMRPPKKPRRRRKSSSS
ncbi:MAG: transposase [Pseudobdellovibrionaceae bacterium]